MKKILLAFLLVLGCNQAITRNGPPSGSNFSPLWIQCPAGGWCDRNTDVCRPATSDWPKGYCAFVGDDGRAFLERDGGAAATRGHPAFETPPSR